MSTSEEFKKHGIVPDVVTKAPEKRAKVVFDSGVESNLGNVLTPTQVQHPPKVTWEAEAGKLYSLIMTEYCTLNAHSFSYPDAPSRKEPKLREWHHWLVVNIPGPELDKGDVLSEYVGVGPPQDTGLHRYVFLIYQQKSKINDPEHGHLTNRSGDKRGGWKAQKFADKHALGDPLAGNFYQAEFDDYVPKLHKQLVVLFLCDPRRVAASDAPVTFFRRFRFRGLVPKRYERVLALAINTIDWVEQRKCNLLLVSQNLLLFQKYMCQIRWPFH
ncbi:hypothetical protein GPALN_004170 [Globodera pallida]|nr:hypothetical protein GPALN_004170 [Globodera pallida]